MSILRNPLKSNYSKIPNALISDARISAGAFRVACYLFSKNDGWSINNNDVKKSLDIKQNSTLAGYWKELLEFGWITRERIKDENGAVSGGYDYSLVLLENHNTKNPTLGETHNTNNKTDSFSKTDLKQPPAPENGGDRDISSSASAAMTPTHTLAWSELLRRKSRPSKGFSAAMTPNPAGNDWERRLHVFDAVRRKYPGTKSGLSVEFDQFLARAHENKIQDIDAELRQMPYAVLYQIKWNEVKKDEGGFVPNWKNFSTWLSKMCWQSDMEAWKSRSEWFNQMCPENTKEAVEALKSILPCK